MIRAKIYGHRGARGERPENTIEGFAHAIAAGAAGLETDIAMTADLCPVLHHDPHLADGRLIRDVAHADLPAHIPTLAAALRTIPDTQWLLEVKTFPPHPEHTHPPALMVRRMLDVIGACGIAEGDLRLLAFDWEVLREAARQAPGLRRICLTAPDTEAGRDLWWGRAITATTPPLAVAQSGAQGWAAFHETLTAGRIAAARAVGLEVFAWTVNDPAAFTRLAPLVDGIITDTPAGFLNATTGRYSAATS